MKPTSISKYILLPCMCIVFAQIKCQFAFSQGVPVSQASQEPTSPNGSQGKQRMPNNIVCHESFFEWIAIEDNQIQKAAQEGKTVGRIDYSSALGISKAEEERMLALILDAEHRIAENKKRRKDSDDAFEIAKQLGTAEAQGLTRPNYQTMVSENWDVFRNAWLSLKQMLGEEDFAKLDSFVNREFARATYPVSLYHPKEELQAAVPANEKYEFFIRHVAAEDRRVQRAIEKGDEVQAQRQDYSRVAGFPESEEPVVLGILLDANRSLQEIDEQIKSITQEFVQEYGPGYKLVKPYPPAIQAMDDRMQALARGRDDISEATKEKLRKDIGEDAYNRLDAWVQRHY